MPSYNPKAIEPRWQRYWEEHKTFRTPDVSDKPKFYILDMFPYPSGAGLHVGHPEGYTATDIYSRYLRMNGRNVLRFPYESVEDFRARDARGMVGIPFLGPWANRLDEHAFYANGRRYAFDMGIGNIRGDLPIHGFLTTTDRWRVVDVKADAQASWVTSRLEFYRDPAWMKQFLALLGSSINP